ncbi:Cutinase transcription factor 1 alpha [Paramyrothecium foliicola]|nr:Cutinase transcription factor 1 alpha [Paramyrothecium foliicola]
MVMGNPRKRARQACVACNSRRVKCDIADKVPCTNCASANVKCTLRESRRGKHPRISRRSRVKDTSSTEPENGPALKESPSDNGQTLPHPDDVAASEVLATLARDRPAANSGRQPVSNDGRQDETLNATSIVSYDDTRPEDEGAEVYLGESSSIRFVRNDATVPQKSGPVVPNRLRLIHRIPNAVKAESLVPEWEAERRRLRINTLRAEGAFTFPKAEAVDTLLTAFFRWFHPCFAVVDEAEIWAGYRQGTLSPLLLNAILFVAVIHCDEETLSQVGLENRRRSKYTFYNKAKDIYDADYEKMKLPVIQALFLMSFWRAGALLEKDARHWLGAAITLSQMKALHRSAGTAKTQLEKLRRRVWWSLYVRERQCAASLGLPHRIRDEDCDCAPLDAGDFEYAYSSATPANLARSITTYQTSMVSLARKLGKIVHSGYLPGRSLTPAQKTSMKDELTTWKRQLPECMQLDNELEYMPNFLASMLHLGYNNLLILLYRSSYPGHESESSDGTGSIALQAAARNSRIIEDMVAAGGFWHAQLHVVTNIFNTLCIHTINLRYADGAMRSIAEHRAKVCLLGLQEIQESWEVKNWVLQLFFQYLDRSTAARLQLGEEGYSVSGAEKSGDRSRRKQQPGTEVPQSQDLAPLLNLEQNNSTGFDGTDTPWTWSNEEQDHFLFSQIENNFTFGEYKVFDWSSEYTFSNMLPELGALGETT